MPSLSTIYKQIEREGARWGLFPVWRGDRVGVAQKVPVLDAMPGGVVVPRDDLQVITSLGEDSPMDAWSAILRLRVRRHERAFEKLVSEQRAAKRAAAQAVIDENKAEIKAYYTRRMLGPRIFSLPGLAR